MSDGDGDAELIAERTGISRRLAQLASTSLRAALARPWVVSHGGRSVTALFEGATAVATRNLHAHSQGTLFPRLILCGPLEEEQPYARGERVDGPLTDDEAEVAIELVRSLMINHFKGALAELLALGPVVDLVEAMFPEEIDDGALRLYWGDAIRQQSESLSTGRRYLKGADGLLLRLSKKGERPGLAAIIEVKSMRLSVPRLRAQLRQHERRLRWGLEVEEEPGTFVEYKAVAGHTRGSDPALIAVIPGGARLSRRFSRVRFENGARSIPVPEPPPESYSEPPRPKMRLGIHLVTLAPSVEELEEAAFSMTYRHMEYAARVAKVEDPDQDRLRHMLYCLGLRPLRNRLRALTARLYNVYCYSYPLSADSRAMLWPEDFPDGDTGVAPAIRYAREPLTFEFDAEGQWKGWTLQTVRRKGKQVTLIRTIRGLPPETTYNVGFHVGAALPKSVSAVVNHGARAPFVLLPPQPSPDPDAPASPFPYDPYIYRVPLGSQTVVSSNRGTVALSFRINSLDKASPLEGLLRLVVALDPV